MGNLLIACIMTIGGLVIIIINSFFQNSILNRIFSDLSSAILISGIISLLYKIFQDKESENTIRRLLRIHDSVDELGLEEIKTEVQAYNFTEIIENSEKLTILMNDGLRWTGNNTIALKNRFSKKTTTEFFLVDPESSFTSILSKKTNKEVGDLQKKIKDTWEIIEATYNDSKKTGELTIYSISTFPTKSIFLTESKLLETPYQIASGRVSIPVYIYKKVTRIDSPFQFAQNDINALREESKIEKQYKRSP